MNEPFGALTFLLLLGTGLFSWFGFRDRHFEERFIFEPQSILVRKEYYRLITAGFLHANWAHLGLNMLSLYLFGGVLELFLGWRHFLVIYLGAILGGSLLSLYVHRHHEYQAYGASGGVCGVIFAHILLLPGTGIYLFPIPFAIPGWLYAVGFILGSFYGMKSARDNIGHDAHLGGAIIGLFITATLHPQIAGQNWKILLLVLGPAVVLLVYLWFNPLFLPLSVFWREGPRAAAGKSSRPPRKSQEQEMDALLDKIARTGLESLTDQEKAFLSETSAKYRRRSETKKPDSGLAI